MLVWDAIKEAVDREGEPWFDGEDHPITATVNELARRVRTDMLRAGAHDWWSDEIAERRLFDHLNEAAIVASYVIVARIAQLKGCRRVARAATVLADMALWNSANVGRLKRKIDIAEQ